MDFPARTPETAVAGLERALRGVMEDAAFFEQIVRRGFDPAYLDGAGTLRGLEEERTRAGLLCYAAPASLANEGDRPMPPLGVPIVCTHRGRIARMAAAARLPMMFARDGARFGPMLAYGTSPAAAGRRVAGMVDRVLKGERPGDMPVERITRHEVVLNLFWVAGKIGVAVSSEVLARADQVVAWSGSARGGVGDDNSGWVLPSGPIHTR